MAGLVAAWELARAGHEPVVLEARARVGGRVHTLREPFTDGLYADVG
jgi:monoamine oxidase